MKDKITLEEVYEIRKELEPRIERLDEEAISFPKYFNKYSKILSIEKVYMNMLLRDKKKLDHTLSLYYSGKASEAVYKEKPQPLKIMKGEIYKYVESDPSMEELMLQIDEQQELVDILKDTVHSLKDRNWAIKSAIDFLKFQSGN